MEDIRALLFKIRSTAKKFIYKNPHNNFNIKSSPSKVVVCLVAYY